MSLSLDWLPVPKKKVGFFLFCLELSIISLYVRSAFFRLLLLPFSRSPDFSCVPPFARSVRARARADEYVSQ